MAHFPTVALSVFLFAAFLAAQNAEVSGLITDPSGLAVPAAKVTVQSADTGAVRTLASNQQGEYSAPALLPGPYNVTVEANGFKILHENGVVFQVDQRVRLDFTLTVGSNTDAITVEGTAPLVSSADASVSTVIDHRFVENLPLNGRSFSSLIDLAPGVVLTPSNQYEAGQFSINGQHPDANYFMVDGVSANIGTAGGGANLAQSGAGQTPATSAFGGTSNLVSLDAVQEFRIETSTFAPEYGRTPGAQISVVTKSGTNVFHGTLFEYFRNDKLDANDWFANQHALARPELRQNDFGGVLGGPIRKDKLFFFGSWESVRVRQPQVANTYEPTQATRASAPAAVQPLLDAFPLPNGPSVGNGEAAFTTGYSNPSSLDSYGLRIDYLLTPKIAIFGRYSDSPSSLDSRSSGTFDSNYSNVREVDYRTRTATIGSNWTITPQLTNEFRFNYSRSRAHALGILDNFGGATPPPNSVLYEPGDTAQNSSFEFLGDLNPYGLRYLVGNIGNNVDRQINVTDNLSRVIGAHQLKFGVDYRRLSPQQDLAAYGQQAVFLSLANVLNDNLAEAFVVARNGDVELAFNNWSLFAQDTWKVTRNLTATYGLRWEYNTPPSSPNGTLPYTVTGLNNLATATLAPAGTALWKAQKDDFAPRLGVAWQPMANWVFRAGGGFFYDLGYSDIADAASTFPYSVSKTVVNTTFPLSAANAAPPVLSFTPPYGYTAVMNPNHVLPRTYEWNAAMERTFGKADVLTATYIGAAGRKLMRQDIYDAPNPNFSGEFDLMSNGADSSYQALQTQFRHRFTHGLQTLLSYTWAHAIDDASSDIYFVSIPGQYVPFSQEKGPSDYDIRHTFSGAISYNIPAPFSGFWKATFGNWSTDSIIYARSAPPVNIVTGTDPFPAGVQTGAFGAVRPNVVPGVPLWIANPNVAGGREINPAAFVVASGAVEGDLGRNALRGLDAVEVDLTVRRQFHLRERLALQARADFFNLFNHPNFGSPINYLTSPQFGQSTQMLGASLGAGGQSGGLNPLYQIGGPRSAQIALKLLF